MTNILIIILILIPIAIVIFKTKKSTKIDNNKFADKNLKKTTYKEKQNKGVEYELFVGNYFKQRGYKIYYNGIKNGLKDMKVDVIAHKENKTILIQCKNWRKNHRWKISDKHIKEFIEGCNRYLAYYRQLKNREIKMIFCASEEIFTKKAEELAKNKKVEILILKND